LESPKAFLKQQFLCSSFGASEFMKALIQILSKHDSESWPGHSMSWIVASIECMKVFMYHVAWHYFPCEPTNSIFLIAKIHMFYLITLLDVGFGSPTIVMPNNFVHFFSTSCTT